MRSPSGYVDGMFMETFIKISRLAGNGRVRSRSRLLHPDFRT
jgi:hypothetical protein